MNTLAQMGDLRRQWQNQQGTPVDTGLLQRQAEAESRAHRRAIVIAAVLTALILAAVFVRAMVTGLPEAWFGAIWTLLFSGAAWPIWLWMSRGTWQPHDTSTASYLDISIRRCRAVLMGAPTSILLYVAGLAGALILRHQLVGDAWGDLLSSPSTVVAGWLGVPLYALASLRYAHRKRQRLAMLLALQRQLGDEPLPKG